MLIALGVSGGIAAYKACEIVRGLREAGVSVQVLMTANAARFIAPLTLRALSGRPVWTDMFDVSTPEVIPHIELTREISAFAVAPATANVLAKFARGIADDLLSTFQTAVTAPVVVAPAMNTRMWLHPVTQENLAVLRSRGVRVVGPESGSLAEGESGWGRMSDPPTIVAAVLDAARRSAQLTGRKIVVSAGRTREPIDPVRFLSNRSSGRMGYALAAAAARRGAEVVLVSGPTSLPPPFGVRVVDVTTAAEMRAALLTVREGAAAIFMAAAVSDFLIRPANSKIKKSSGGITLALEPAPDILVELARDRGATVLVGFAAETEDLLQNARFKLESKNLDFVVANDVSREGLGFESDRNAVTVLDRAGGQTAVPEASKTEIAETILDRVFDEGTRG